MTDANVKQDGAHGQSTPSSLIGLLEGKNPEGWSRFVQLYSPLIYFWCRNRGLQHADALDLQQNVFRAAVQNFENFHHDRQGDTLRGWLRTITRHKICDWARKKSKEPENLDNAEIQKIVEIAESSVHGEFLPETPDEELLLQRQAVEIVLQAQDPVKQQAFRMLVIDGRTAADVASELGLTRNTVYLVKSKILKRIREEFEGLIGELPK